MDQAKQFVVTVPPSLPATVSVLPSHIQVRLAQSTDGTGLMNLQLSKVDCSIFTHFTSAPVITFPLYPRGGETLCSASAHWGSVSCSMAMTKPSLKSPEIAVGQELYWQWTQYSKIIASRIILEMSAKLLMDLQDAPSLVPVKDLWQMLTAMPYSRWPVTLLNVIVLTNSLEYRSRLLSVCGMNVWCWNQDQDKLNEATGLQGFLHLASNTETMQKDYSHGVAWFNKCLIYSKRPLRTGFCDISEFTSRWIHLLVWGWLTGMNRTRFPSRSASWPSIWRPHTEPTWSAFPFLGTNRAFYSKLPLLDIPSSTLITKCYSSLRTRYLLQVLPWQSQTILFRTLSTD